MTQKRNCKEFSCKVNGKEYRFKCYTTWTRNGFCHTVVSLDYDVRDTKVSYINRTWERFDYETALKGMIRKFPKDMQAEMKRQLIDGEAAAENERCEAMFGAFQKLHAGLTEENKKRLQDLPPMENEAQVHATMGLMALMTVMQ